MNFRKASLSATLAAVICLLVSSAVFAQINEEINSVEGLEGRNGLLAIIERKIEGVTINIAPGVTATTKDSTNHYLFFVLDNKHDGSVFEDSGTVLLEGETVRPFTMSNCLTRDIDISLKMEPPASKAFYKRVVIRDGRVLAVAEVQIGPPTDSKNSVTIYYPLHFLFQNSREHFFDTFFRTPTFATCSNL